MKEKFLSEIEEQIRITKRFELAYWCVQTFLMLLITICGFLTAASTNEVTKNLWVSNPNSVLFFGLISAISAIANQVVAPQEKYIFHKNYKKVLRNIRGAVMYSGMDISEAESLRAQASTKPSSVIDRLTKHNKSSA